MHNDSVTTLIVKKEKARGHSTIMFTMVAMLLSGHHLSY